MALLGFANAATLTNADNGNPGSGITTFGKTQQTSLAAAGQNDAAFTGTPVGPASAHSGASANVIPWWVALIILLVAVKFIAEKNDEGAEFKNIRVGFFNIMIVTLMAIIGLTLAKWFFGLYLVPGISPLVEAA